MTPEERQLVTGLFDRMRNYTLPEKDGEAEALINERVRAVPDSAYMLVQSVLVQEQALQAADERIRALEEQVRALEAQQRQPSSGGFLGGLFGSRSSAPEPARGPSVPVIGARATPPLYAGAQPGRPGQPAPRDRRGKPPGSRRRLRDRRVKPAAAGSCARPWRRPPASQVACSSPARSRT